MLFVLSLVHALKEIFNELTNGKIQININKKLNILFLQRHNHSQTFRVKFVKNRQKNITKELIFNILDTPQLKKVVTVKIFTVEILCI